MGNKGDRRGSRCELRHCGIGKGVGRHRISHAMKGRPERMRNRKYRK